MLMIVSAFGFTLDVQGSHIMLSPWGQSWTLSRSEDYGLMLERPKTGAVWAQFGVVIQPDGYRLPIPRRQRARAQVTA